MPPGAPSALATACRGALPLVTGLLAGVAPAAAWSWRSRVGGTLHAGLASGAVGGPPKELRAYGTYTYYDDSHYAVPDADTGFPGEEPSPGEPAGAPAQDPPSGGEPPPRGPPLPGS